MNTVKPVQLEDRVCFHCTRCGNCCRDLEGQLMLEPADAYDLARVLRAQGRAESIDDLYERYAHADILESNLPIYLMNTAGYDHACVFWANGRCSVYEGRPQMCRIYPLFVCPEEPGHPFEAFQCMDRHVAHFTGGKVLVKDWLHENFSKERRAIMTAETAVVPELGCLLQGVNFNEDKAGLFQILHYRYYNYDLDEPFLPQYMSNMAALEKFLRERAGGGLSNVCTGAADKPPLETVRCLREPPPVGSGAGRPAPAKGLAGGG